MHKAEVRSRSGMVDRFWALIEISLKGDRKPFVNVVFDGCRVFTR
jgi:hypothetical protein